MDKKSIYLMPGMGANPRIFERIEFPKNYDIVYLSWFPPNKDESLEQYAQRMCSRIHHQNPILLGVSFGGVLVQEMANFINCERVIIVSSIKSDQELPQPMKLAKVTNVHKLLPTKWIQNIEVFALFVFGDAIRVRLKRYQRYLSERDPEYLNWAIDRLVKWDKNKPLSQLIHIHGVDDVVFPFRNIQRPVIKIPGDHAIILTQSEWFTQNLPIILSGNFEDLINLE